ncbi:hypothetical protein I546_3230 [Mycobacterium kansasii 732]|nr:hypothetical protein I546_3230 [Mycobacterium kansasii 732]
MLGTVLNHPDTPSPRFNTPEPNTPTFPTPEYRPTFHHPEPPPTFPNPDAPPTPLLKNPDDGTPVEFPTPGPAATCNTGITTGPSAGPEKSNCND